MYLNGRCLFTLPSSALVLFPYRSGVSCCSVFHHPKVSEHRSKLHKVSHLSTFFPPLKLIIPFLVSREHSEMSISCRIYTNDSFSLIFAGLGMIPPATAVNYVPWVIIGFIFQYLVRRKHFAYWAKYNCQYSVLSYTWCSC